MSELDQAAAAEIPNVEIPDDTGGVKVVEEAKPIEIDQTKWTVEEKADLQKNGYRVRRDGEAPLVSAKIRPEDYENSQLRGSVELIQDWYNYSFHNVEIPEGSTLRNCNFTQSVPATDSITGDYEITFIDCNLGNVLVNPNWILENCTTSQFWFLNDGDILVIAPNSNELPKDMTPPPNVLIPGE